MIIYNVTINIDESSHDDWFDFMTNVHIKEVMDTGFFKEARFSKILAEEEGGRSYSIQYLCDSMEILEKYQAEQAPRLQEDHNRKFEGRFVAFRTLLRVDKMY